MAQIRARGIIVKQSDYGEGHRMLSIFTEEYGIVKAVSYGVKKSKSKTGAASQFLCYADFDLYQGVNRDVMNVNSVETIDAFYPLSEDIKKLSLCVYLADITYSLLGMNNPDERILRLFLNSVYALAYRNALLQKVKTVYELKLMCAGGYMPTVNECVSCGKKDVYAFDLSKGGAVCRECGGKYAVPLNKTLIRALEYIISCDDKKMLAFNAGEDLLNSLASLTERYVLTQLDRQFSSLDYYKTMLEM